MSSSTSEKIQTLSHLSHIVKNLKKEGKKIVLCHGVFDLIHPGHIRHLAQAKKYGDVLVVTLIADAHVKRGPGRPIFTHQLRGEVLSAISSVDYVAIIASDSPVVAINIIKPHVFVEGFDDRKKQQVSDQKLVPTDVETAVRALGGTVVYTKDIMFSSSRLINVYFDVYPTRTKAFLQSFQKKYTDGTIIEKLHELSSLKVLVVGDAIIDQYVYSDPMGKSTKEPITVHKYLSEESFAGGALATANHLAALCDRVTLVTLLGAKRPFDTFIRAHMRPQVKLKLFSQDDSETIVKRRYIDQQTTQKLFQITYIKDTEGLGRVEESIVKYLKAEIPKYDCVVVNDFGHGILTKRVIRAIYSKAKYVALNVQANSANFGFNIITKYPRANFVCIDDLELRLATHNRYGDIQSLAKRIYSKLHTDGIIITRGHQGASSYSTKTGFITIPALTQTIVDRVGAGDALFAITAPCMYGGFPLDLATFIGNVAGALKIATVGNKYPIDFDEMTQFITRLLK